jgi:hypothetical protein
MKNSRNFKKCKIVFKNMECDIFVYENVDAILIQKKLIQTVSSKFYDTNIVGHITLKGTYKKYTFDLDKTNNTFYCEEMEVKSYRSSYKEVFIKIENEIHKTIIYESYKHLYIKASNDKLVENLSLYNDEILYKGENILYNGIYAEIDETDLFDFDKNIKLSLSTIKEFNEYFNNFSF